MKTDRQTYGFSIGIFRRKNKYSEGPLENYKEQLGSDPPGRHRARLIEYHVRMQQEENKYSQLLMKLKKASWLIQLSPPLGRSATGSSESDVGTLPGGECDVGLIMDELASSGLEAPMLTKDEVRYGYGFTMEQILLGWCDKQPSIDVGRCLERTNTQQSRTFRHTISIRDRIVFRSPMMEGIQQARNKLSESDVGISMNANRLWLEVGGPYSDFSECDSTAATDFAGPHSSRKIGNWDPGSHWHKFMPSKWDSVMVESVRLVMQRWRGVCSFSQTMRGNRSIEKYQNTYSLCYKKRSRPGE